MGCKTCESQSGSNLIQQKKQKKDIYQVKKVPRLRALTGVIAGEP